MLVFAYAWLLYSNTLDNRFVWDDRVLIVENTDIRTLDAGAVKDSFTQHYWHMTGKAGGLYRPLSALSFHLDYQIHGDSPRGYHATNTTINAIVCALVFLFVYLLFGSKVQALVVAVLFAAFPVHTENVAWVSGRTDLLAAMFVLLSLIAYVMWRRRGGFWWPAISLIAFLAGVLSKELALVLPPVVMVLELGPFGGHRRSRTRRVIGVATVFVVVSILYFIARRAVLGNSVQSFVPVVTGVANTAALSFSTLAHYVYKLVYPFALNAESQFPVPGSLVNLHSVAGIVLLFGLGYAIWRFRHDGALLLSATLFLVAIAPVLHVFPITQISAERFLYLPSLGFVLFLGTMITRSLEKKGRTSTVALFAFTALTVSYSVKTYSRNFDWRNETTLFEHTVATADDNARAHLNLGNTRYRAGNYEDALAEYRKALDLDSGYAAAWAGVAGASMKIGRIDDAIRSIDRALELEPRNADYHNSRGTLYIQREEYEEAESAFRRAVTINPSHEKAGFNLGLAAFFRENYAEARDILAALPHKEVDFVHAYYYLAECNRELGNHAGAIEQARKFLSLYPQNDQYSQRARSIISGK